MFRLSVTTLVKCKCSRANGDRVSITGTNTVKLDARLISMQFALMYFTSRFAKLNLC